MTLVPADTPSYSCIIPLADAEETAHLGRRFSAFLRPGDVVLLHGPIGAGKTHFARSIIQTRLEALGQYEDVPSPTFTLVQVYELADAEIWHADLYRLTNPSEVDELGLIDAFETEICLIEWPDRLGDLTPSTALHVRFESVGDGRLVRIEGDADWGRRLEGMMP